MTDTWVIRVTQGNGSQYLAYNGHEYPTRACAEADAQGIRDVHGHTAEVLPTWKGKP